MGKHVKGLAKHAKPGDYALAKKAAIVTGGATLLPLTFANLAMADDYTVQHGDTLSGIAASHHVGLDILEPLNPGIIAGNRPDDFSLIFAGGHIHLPPMSEPLPASPVVRHNRWHKRHVFYKDCSVAPPGLHRGQPGYRHALDMDGDGKACEGPWPPVVAPPPPPPPVVTPPVVTPPPVVGDGDNDGDDGTVAPPPVTPPPVTPPVVTPPVTGGLVTPVILPDCPGTSSGYCTHSPSFWIPLIQQAEQLVPLRGGPQISSVVTRITIESSGNPNAINLSDSNAQRGDPSRGLMQTIGATFNAFHVAGTSQNIYNPLANIAAALNYINHQYNGVVPLGPSY